VAIICICRGTRSGGQALVECLAKRLHYPTIGRDILQQAASKLGVSEKDLTQKMERAPKLWDRHAATRRVYVVAVQSALAEYAAEGNLIYHGLAGQFLLKGLPAVLRVRLIAPMESRIRAVMEGNQKDRAAAEQYIQEIDAARAHWVKMMYGEHIEDPALYDMVLNLEAMSIPAACALLMRTVEQPEFDLTDQVKSKLEGFRLACRVKTALVAAAETRALTLEVDAAGGIVEVSGTAPLLSTGQTGDNISTIARSVPGVKDVRLKVQWFDPYP
jgi:cytidylate kinase